MKVIITGANGFVGASLCRYFCDRGHHVVATGRQIKPNNKLLSYASYIAADVTEPVNDFDADICIHAAGLATDKADYHELFLNNVTGTLNIIAASKNCKYVIFISSSSVYDFTDDASVENSATLNARLTDYGRTKLMAEELVKTNIPVVQRRLILRPRAIYGIGDRILLSRLLKLVKWHKIFYPAAKHLQTSATHINNIGYAIELFLNQKDKPAIQIFNIADDEVYLLKDLTVRILDAVEEHSLRVIDVPLYFFKILAFIAPKRISGLTLRTVQRNSILDLENIKSALGYKPVHNFYNSYLEIGAWIKKIGGKKIYLDNLPDAPWL